jgi:hypothetical protein
VIAQVRVLGHLRNWKYAGPSLATPPINPCRLPFVARLIFRRSPMLLLQGLIRSKRREGEKRGRDREREERERRGEREEREERRERRERREKRREGEEREGERRREEREKRIEKERKGEEDHTSSRRSVLLYLSLERFKVGEPVLDRSPPGLVKIGELSGDCGAKNFSCCNCKIVKLIQ